MATCTVSGTLRDPSATAISGVTVSFKIVRGTANGESANFYIPKTLSTTTAADGTWSITMEQGLSGVISIDYIADSLSPANRLNYTVDIPSTSTATFNSLVTEV